MTRSIFRSISLAVVFGIGMSSCIGGGLNPNTVIIVTGVTPSPTPTSVSTYSVTLSGTNVTLTPSAVQTVSSGATLAITVTPSASYTTSASVGGTCATGSWAGTIYTTGAITANCTVLFSATLNSYTVSASVDAHSAISPSVNQTVSAGGSQAYTVTPASGYSALPTVGGTCASGTWSAAIYTTGAITANCTVIFSSSAAITYVYQTNSTYSLAQIGSRSATTTACGSTYTANNGSWGLSCSNFVAMLGFAADGGVTDLPGSYGVPINSAFESVDGSITFASNWSAFSDTSVNRLNSPQTTTAGFTTSVQIWTGINSNGSMTSTTNCADWTLGSPYGANYSQIDSGGITSFSWDGGSTNCAGGGAAFSYLCLCWI
jgi:hypothetical protein